MPIPYWLLADLWLYLVQLGLPARTANQIIWALAQLRVY